MDEEDVREGGFQVALKQRKESKLEVIGSDNVVGRAVVSELLRQKRDKSKVQMRYFQQENVLLASGGQGLGADNTQLFFGGKVDEQRGTSGATSDQKGRERLTQGAPNRNRIYISQLGETNAGDKYLSKKNVDFTDQNEDEDNIFYFGAETNRPIEYNFYESGEGGQKMSLKKIKEEDAAYADQLRLQSRPRASVDELFEAAGELEMEITHQFEENIPGDFDFYLRIEKRDDEGTKKSGTSKIDRMAGRRATRST